MAFHAGAQFEMGAQGETQCGSIMFQLGSVDTATAGELARPQIRDLLKWAVADGYPLPCTTTGVHINPLDGVVHLNVTKLSKADGRPFNLLDPADLSAAEREGRRPVRVYEEAFRKYIPGFGRARVIDIGATMGIRETRRIAGEQTLTVEAVRACEKPADRIACSVWPLEIHGAGRNTIWLFLPDREYYGIPFGCLVVKGFDNLLVAGRNFSASHDAQASARVAGPCFAMGEAAGTTAAMALGHASRVPEVQTALRQRQLEEQGQYSRRRFDARSALRLRLLCCRQCEQHSS